MKLFSRIIIFLFILFDVFLFFKVLLNGHTLTVLNPTGLRALQERDLIFLIGGIGVTIIIIVLITAFSIAWKYREGNNVKKEYVPNMQRGAWYYVLLWMFPLSVVLLFSVIVWKSTHALDPYKPIASQTKPLTIEVVALRWKWLFIYPQKHIATVNYIQFPVHTPVTFLLTADDAPMNSFWIPALSGQMYSMTGMETQLHILSDKAGTFNGSAAEISGQGFAGMKFVAEARSTEDFTQWVHSIQQTSKPLDAMSYAQLLKPSENNPAAFYSPVDKNLYNMIMMKYMSPSPSISPTTIEEMKMQ